MRHFLILPLVALAACSGAPDAFQPRSVDLRASSPAPDVTIPEDWVLEDDAYAVSGGPGDPSPADLSSVPLPSVRVERLELVDVSLRDVARTLIVDRFGLAVMYASSQEPPVVTFSGGPFGLEDGLSALEDLVRGQSMSFRRVGDLVVISDGTEQSSEATGYTRVYRTDAEAVAEAVAELHSQVRARAVGRSVALSGPSAAVRQALALVRDLDRDAVSSLPWVVLRLSPDVAGEASGIVSALSDEGSPLSLTTHGLGRSGLVLLVGHSRAAVDEAAGVLRALEAGVPRPISRSLAVADPSAAAEVIAATFAAEVEAGDLSVARTSSEIVLRGLPSAVSSAYALADDLHGGLDYVEVRAIVAETIRGSKVDRAMSMSVDGGDLGLVLGGSVDGASLSASAGSFRAALSWLDRDADTRLLATPRLSVVSGGSADLSVGSQVPVLGRETTADDGSTSRSVDYRDTGVVLRVEPVVLSDGRISVGVTQELSTAGVNALTTLDSPVFDQRRLVTDLVLEPGEIVAAGGLDYAVSEATRSGTLPTGSTGSTSARKLVVLLTADVKGTEDRRRAVEDALADLSSILRAGGRS